MAVGNLVLALLRSADCCASEMVVQASLATASLGLQVLETTDRIPVVLVVVVQVSIAVVVEQEHDVRVIAIALSRTPEVRVVALEADIPIVVPVASRQRRESVGVRPVAVLPLRIIPAACGLEHPTRCTGSADCSEQSFKFRFCWQVPALGTNTANRVCRRTSLAIAATLAVRRPCSHAVHRGCPGVKTTVLGAVGKGVAIAPTSGIGGVATIYISVFIGNTSVGIVQILCHPDLRTDSDRLVGLAIAGVC